MRAIPQNHIHIFECTSVARCGMRNANKVPNGPAILDSYRPSRTALARPPMPAAGKAHWQVPVSPGIAHMRTQPGSVARHDAMQLANKWPNTKSVQSRGPYRRSRMALARLRSWATSHICMQVAMAVWKNGTAEVARSAIKFVPASGAL